MTDDVDTAKPPLTGGAATPRELAAAKQRIARRSRELDLVRASAAKWQGGLAGLLAIVTGLSATSLRPELTRLADPWPVVAAALVGLSLAVAVGATLGALRASGGMPRLFGRTDAGLDQDDHAEATASAGRLQKAVRLTVAALALFALAVGITWFGPEAESDGLSVVLELAGDDVCGSITVVVGGVVFVTTSDGDAAKLRVAKIEGITPVEACP